MENEIKVCPHDCMKCHPNQRLYCAANWSRMMVEKMDELMQRFDAIEEKVDALDKYDEGVFNPMAEDDEEQAEEEHN